MKKSYKALVEDMSGDRHVLEMKTKNKAWYVENAEEMKLTVVSGIVEETEVFDYIMLHADSVFIINDKKEWNKAKRAARVALNK